MSLNIRAEADRHAELLTAAQSLLDRLKSPQKYLYFTCSYASAGKSLPVFDPYEYFESRGMSADEKSMGMLHDLLELYANALVHIDDFNLKLKYLSAPHLVMDENLSEVSAQIVELHAVFFENHETLRRYMTSNGMLEGVIAFPSQKQDRT